MTLLIQLVLAVCLAQLAWWLATDTDKRLPLAAGSGGEARIPPRQLPRQDRRTENRRRF